MGDKKRRKGKALKAKLIYNPGSGNHPDATARLERLVRCLEAQDIRVDVAVAKPSEAATFSKPSGHGQANGAIKNASPVASNRP